MHWCNKIKQLGRCGNVWEREWRTCGISLQPSNWPWIFRSTEVEGDKMRHGFWKQTSICWNLKHLETSWNCPKQFWNKATGHATPNVLHVRMAPNLRPSCGQLDPSKLAPDRSWDFGREDIKIIKENVQICATSWQRSSHVSSLSSWTADTFPLFPPPRLTVYPGKNGKTTALQRLRCCIIAFEMPLGLDRFGQPSVPWVCWAWPKPIHRGFGGSAPGWSWDWERSVWNICQVVPSRQRQLYPSSSCERASTVLSWFITSELSGFWMLVSAMQKAVSFFGSIFKTGSCLH